MTKERRRYLRAGSALEVWLGQDGIYSRRDEKLIVLGAGGAYIQSQREFRVGSLVNLRFRLRHNEEFMTCQAVIRAFDQGQGAGVEFIDVAKDDRVKIRHFVENLLISAALHRKSIRNAEAAATVVRAT